MAGGGILQNAPSRAANLQRPGAALRRLLSDLLPVPAISTLLASAQVHLGSIYVALSGPHSLPADYGDVAEKSPLSRRGQIPTFDPEAAYLKAREGERGTPAARRTRRDTAGL